LGWASAFGPSLLADTIASIAVAHFCESFFGCSRRRLPYGDLWLVAPEVPDIADSRPIAEI
jgi:hypothetical protein